MSQLFDALLMAATGPATDGRAAGAGGAAAAASAPPAAALAAEPAAAAAAAAAIAAATAAATGAAAPAANGVLANGSAAAAAAAAAPAPGGGGAAVVTSGRQHAPPNRQRSRLFSALSYGDADSLQNALDAFRAEDEIVSGVLRWVNARAGGGGGGFDAWVRRSAAALHPAPLILPPTHPPARLPVRPQAGPRCQTAWAAWRAPSGGGSASRSAAPAARTCPSWTRGCWAAC